MVSDQDRVWDLVTKDISDTKQSLRRLEEHSRKSLRRIEDDMKDIFVQLENHKIRLGFISATTGFIAGSWHQILELFK